MSSPDGAHGAPRFEIDKETSVQVNISVRHGNLSAGTQEKITEKAEKLRRLFDRVTAIQVTVDLEHEDKPSLELQVSAEHSADFVATESAGNVFAALDGAVHKIEQQLRKHKEKKITGHRVPGRKQIEVTLEPEGERD
jgi:putative sigma-54 modulation protein